MSDTRQLIVRRIKNGTVIDHIESPRALLVLNILNMTGQEGDVITVALNVPSIKHKKKDIIKVENKFLEKKGYRILRFWNDDIFKKTEAILNEILATLNETS